MLWDRKLEIQKEEDDQQMKQDKARAVRLRIDSIAASNVTSRAHPPFK
jgi:hypothetical protein